MWDYRRTGWWMGLDGGWWLVDGWLVDGWLVDGWLVDGWLVDGG
jgi:hypothetical protein